MDDTQLLRYNRHILLPQIGITGQERLLHSKVLIVGLGGLGAPAAMYLASAGVGHLWLCDFDVVELSNLQRQIIHTTCDLGKAKVISAKETLERLNPLISITALHQSCHEESLTDIIANVDVVLDCTDNLSTRLAINRGCVLTATPLISGAAIRMEGQIAVFRHDLPSSPCYQCLYPHEIPIETCVQTGILTPVVGIIGSLQAIETLKLLVKVGETLAGRLLLIDALNMEWYDIKLTQNPHCPVCANRELAQSL